MSFDLSLARGLTYYTGLIYECVVVDGGIKVCCLVLGAWQKVCVLFAGVASINCNRNFGSVRAGISQCTS